MVARLSHNRIFAFKVERNGIETGVNMQVSAGEHIGPSAQVLILGEVEHGHDGLGAPRQNGQLVFGICRGRVPVHR